MLELLDSPQVTGTSESRRGQVTWKTAYLFGNHEVISDVMQKRLADKQCHQAPRRSPIPKNYHIRVRYGVDPEGIFIVHVDVKLGKRWVPLTAEDRAINSAAERFHFTYHDLHDAMCVYDIIDEYEKDRVICQLNKLGPGAFAEVDEEN